MKTLILKIPRRENHVEDFDGDDDTENEEDSKDKKEKEAGGDQDEIEMNNGQIVDWTGNKDQGKAARDDEDESNATAGKEEHGVTSSELEDEARDLFESKAESATPGHSPGTRARFRELIDKILLQLRASKRKDSQTSTDSE